MYIGEKIVKTKKCKHCNTSFDITDKDLEFYDKISPIFAGEKYEIPTPNFCPDCRQQRRLSFFNLRSLYKNICNSCNKEIVSRFHVESGIKNYCNECWSKDDWNQLKQGVDIDFNQSFFSQISYLIKNTYFQNLIGSSSNVINNSIYTNHTSEIHNSYFVFEANKINDSYYGYTLKNSNNILDSSFIGNSEYLYECTDCYSMYNTYYSKNSFSCRFSYFLDNCTNCSYCIGCVNLINKDYYLFNEEISKEEYEKLKINLSNYDFLKDFEKKYSEFCKKQIKKSSNIVGSENCVGDNIVSSSNCINCFDILESSDCKNSNSVNYSSDLFDISSYGEESSLMYDSVSVGRYSKNLLFSSIVGKGEKLIYCIDVKKSKNCFGCVNLEEKEYCILNKQYTKEEYENLVPQIIDHMNKMGEWGEFFPSNISPFGYNETVAMEYFQVIFPNHENSPHPNPLPMGEGIQGGGQGIFNRSNYQSPFPKVEKTIQAIKLPNNIKDIPDDILNWAIECEITKKPFKIISQELEFYRKHNLPIPRRHPDQRHLDRMKLRKPRKLYERKCDKCGIIMKTPYSPENEDVVYCEKCYNGEVY